jgi:hypothetical protein
MDTYQVLINATETGNHLQRQFQPRVQSLEEQYRGLIIDKNPSVIQLPFISVNGSAASQPQHHHRQEPQPPFPYPDSQLPLHRKNSLPHPTFMPTHTPSSQSQPPQPWSPSFAYLPQPHPHSQTQVTSPIYSAFSQSPMSGLSAGPVQQTVPTSLASLLNDSGSIYVNYPTPPQSQNGLNGDSYMSFQPNHYFDGPGRLTWPLISMPPGAQS